MGGDAAPNSGSGMAPFWVVDSLPARWWTYGNLHFVFGRSMHFCTSSSRRRIGFNGHEVARGRKLLSSPEDSVAEADSSRSVFEPDLGWLLVRAITTVVALVVIMRIITRRLLDRR